MSSQFPRGQYEDPSMTMDSSLSGQWNVAQEPQASTSYPEQTQTIISDNADGGGATVSVAASRRQGERLPPFSFITNPTINQILIQINPDLFISKLFYFFFYSAFGSLFPLMAVYFKQLGMNPIQAGTLVGIRPFVEFIAAPFWSSIADRFHKSKVILLFSLGCWIVFTFAMAFIRPPASACVIFNETHHILYTPYSNTPGEEVYDDTSTLLPTTEEYIPNSSVISNSVSESDTFVTNQNFRFKRDASQNIKHKLPPNHVVGKSPLTVEYALNYNQEKHVTYLSPPFSTIVYKLEDVKEVFFLLLLLIVLGEFLSAPAITLADSATLDYLGEDIDKYGQQRMYGSFGWGITMLLVGMALDNSTKFKDHPCDPHSGERNYVTCFSIFAFLMSCTLLIATKFKFEESPEYSNEIQLNSYENEPGPKPWQNTAPAINIPKEFQEKNRKGEIIDRWKSAVFAQRTRTLPSWVAVLRSMNDSRKLAFLLVTWLMGFGVGLVFTFLFWHLQDLGGTPTLYGYASVINHISEIGAYFFSINLIQRFGHTKVLCFGLLCNAFRFIYISWLDNPWWVLPLELIQGVTHATVWAAACSYMTQNTELELRASAQGVMQGIYQGLGRGSGSLLGGVIINRFGSRITFFLYGLICAAVLGLFVHLNYYRKNEGYKFEEQIIEDPVITINDSSALAPHGVPTNPIARSVSRHNVDQSENHLQQSKPINNRMEGNWNTNDNENFASNSNNTWDPNVVWN
uniref:Major facilitator superfamily domain-containing protein 6-like n=1 Tax=Dermatophagoides pteronyssinus TaxID=6956 RepID=A0A6P6XM46_DERPT|nr:major facilitator superfamily domain-containing protein 6-like [Dermatophagoides pteronyssinus]